MTYASKKRNTGFTLVETLVAITILLLVVIGPITIAQKGVQNAYYANERVIATFLAQEAIEGVRTYRDNVALGAFDDEDDLPSGTTAAWVPTGCGGGCSGRAYVKEEDNPVIACTNPLANNCDLRFDTSDNTYTHSISAENTSPFRRTVAIGAVDNGGRLVTVTVTWSGRIYGGAQQSVTLRTWLYDHYQRFEDK